jgi:phage tail sheath gpL-like
VATNGQTQIVENTAIGPITTAGNLTVTVTAAGMTGSPRAVSVAVLATDSNASLAQKIAAALNADADVLTFFTALAINNTVKLTAINAAANDATMNMAFANGTSAGLTAEPTAVQYRAGIAPGAAIADSIQTWFLTNSAGQLVAAANAPSVTNLTAAGQGVVVTPDFVWGG